MVAKQLDRHYVGIELKPDYKELAEARIGGEAVSYTHLDVSKRQTYGYPVPRAKETSS